MRLDPLPIFSSATKQAGSIVREIARSLPYCLHSEAKYNLSSNFYEKILETKKSITGGLRDGFDCSMKAFLAMLK
jgi:hypothetical protein